MRCFAVWRHHPFVTNSELPTAESEITHRRHAIIETTFADLIDGPLANIPGCSPPTAPGLGCAVIAHNLLRAACTSSRAGVYRGGQGLVGGLTHTPPRPHPAADFVTQLSLR